MSKALTYDQYGNAETKKEFLEKHAILVRRIAHHLMVRLPPNVLLEDLIQAGMIGLLEASMNYDHTKGASFETFAGIRIRGAMLDEIRRGDWVPRKVHRQNREVQYAINMLESQLNRDPTDKEIANYLDMGLDDYHRVIMDINNSRLLDVEDAASADIGINIEGNIPLQGVCDDAFKYALVEAIKNLPEREAMVLSLYYDEELNLKEIGAVLNVSESRISQILSQTMQRLRCKLSAWIK